MTSQNWEWLLVNLWAVGKVPFWAWRPSLAVKYEMNADADICHHGTETRSSWLSSFSSQFCETEALSPWVVTHTMKTSEPVVRRLCPDATPLSVPRRLMVLKNSAVETYRAVTEGTGELAPAIIGIAWTNTETWRSNKYINTFTGQGQDDRASPQLFTSVCLIANYKAPSIWLAWSSNLPRST